MTGALRIREAVRAVVVDPDDRFLLVRWILGGLNVWGTPGGGIEPDEDVEAALRRELDEELGIGATATIGPQIWDRVHLVPFLDGRWDGQHDRCFLVRTERFEPRPALSVEQLEAEHLVQLRWWGVDELMAFRPTAEEFFAPRRLPQLAADLAAHGPPPAIVHTGI